MVIHQRRMVSAVKVAVSPSLRPRPSRCRRPRRRRVGDGLARLAGEVVDVDPAGRPPGARCVRRWRIRPDQFLLLASTLIAGSPSSRAAVTWPLRVAELGRRGRGAGRLRRARRWPAGYTRRGPVRQPSTLWWGDRGGPAGWQLLGQGAGRLRGPPQPGHRIPPGSRARPRRPRLQQSGIVLGQRLRRPPADGTTGDGSTPASSSSTPVVTVIRDTPAARATSEIPP